MDSKALAAHLSAGRFDDAADLLTSYTIPHVTEREEDFIIHDLAVDGAQVLAGTFEPAGLRVMIDLDSAFAMVGMSRGALLFYLGQPDVPGACLHDCGGKELPGVQLHSMASVCGDSPWAGTASRRMVFEVDPDKPVTWQVVAAIIGPSAVTPVAAPAQVAVTPDGSHAFVTSPTLGTVTPIALGRPLFSYTRIQRPDDVGLPPIDVGTGAELLAAGDARAVVTNPSADAVNITLVDVATAGATSQIQLPGALGVALTPDGSHAVIGTTTGSVALLELDTEEVVSRQLPGAGRIRGIGVLVDGSAVFVADADAGVVHRLALPSLEVEATVDVGAAPWVVRVAPDGQVWVLGRDEDVKGHLRRIDPATNTVEETHELPYPRPNDLAIVPVAGQTDELVRTAWTVYDHGYSEFYIGGPFTGQAHTWHTAEFPGDAIGPTSIAVNDYGEIWVVRPSIDHLYKWPGGRFLIRPGIFYGEYCSVSVYGART